MEQSPVEVSKTAATVKLVKADAAQYSSNKTAKKVIVLNPKDIIPNNAVAENQNR